MWPLERSAGRRPGCRSWTLAAQLTRGMTCAMGSAAPSPWLGKEIPHREA
jgi:hypothetical protein